MTNNTLSAEDVERAARAPRTFAPENGIRALGIGAVEGAQSRHPGAPMGMGCAATVLLRDPLPFDATDPDRSDRVRVVGSKGHASMQLHSRRHLNGCADMTRDQIGHFRQSGATTAGQRDHGHASGIETTTGPFGQGPGRAEPLCETLKITRAAILAPRAHRLQEG